METKQRGPRPGEIAEVSLREMVAHLNVIDASIDAMGAGLDSGLAARDFLTRLDVLAFSAARLHIPDVPRIIDALEELVLAAHVYRTRPPEEIAATLRHGVDVLMLLTHDKMRRMQGYPGAELRPATEAVVERVARLVGSQAEIRPTTMKVAGL